MTAVATPRKAISKKTRFEVFKRDGFKCVYCGASAPEAVLVVDHIEPLAKGGVNEIVNYATACQPCNAGKSDRKLTDHSALQKQRRQLDELALRREQLEMLLEWRNGLKASTTMEVDVVCEAFDERTPGWSLNEKGRLEAKKLLRKHDLNDILDAIDVAADNYLKKNAEGAITSESVGVAWKKIGGILALQSMSEDQRRLYYVQGILRNRVDHLPFDLIDRLKFGLERGVGVEDMVLQAKRCRSWSQFNSWMLD